MSDDWDESASAWIEEMAVDRGDFAREFILDTPMLEQARSKASGDVLDVGCGEGRFCRMLRAGGARTVGIDPTRALIDHARRLDPEGDYRIGNAETLEFPDNSFDLVVSYLSLIDIPDVEKAIPEMARVLRPDGMLLIANLNGFASAGVGGGWTTDTGGNRHFCIDDYLSERYEWAEWRGIKVRNWHRPLGLYISLLLAAGLTLRYFDEPAPSGGDPQKSSLYRRVPLFVVTSWQKPKAT